MCAAAVWALASEPNTLARMPAGKLTKAMLEGIQEVREEEEEQLRELRAAMREEAEQEAAEEAAAQGLPEGAELELSPEVGPGILKSLFGGIAEAHLTKSGPALV